LTDQIEVKVFAVNGLNRSVDVNTGKSFGAQVNLKPTDGLLVAAGYMGGPEQPDTETDAAGNDHQGAAREQAPPPPRRSRGRRHADREAAPALQRRLRAGEARRSDGALVRRKPRRRVRVHRRLLGGGPWRVLRRPGRLHARDGEKTTLVDGTLTLAAAPTKNLLLKLDTRLDRATVDGVPEGIFLKGLTEPSKTQVTATFGVVATTN